MGQWLSEVRMEHFRNIREAALDLSPRLTLWVGENGQGKTNGLEAVYFLLTGRALRTTVLKEMIQYGEAWLRVSGTLKQDDDSASILPLARSLDRDGRTGKRAPRQPVVVFSPEDLDIVKGAPSARRHFLDVLLSMLSTRYAASWRQYERALQQRNRAIKDLRSDPRPKRRSILEGYGTLLAEHGSHLWRERVQGLQSLVPWVDAAHQEIAGSLSLRVRLLAGGVDEPLFAKEAYEAALHASFDLELARGFTVVGPHRDDLEIRLDGQDAARYASQGQQRSIMVALRLGSFHLLHQELGMRPIVLLDDVLSELDSARRERLLRFIASGSHQTIVTDTEVAAYQHLAPTICRVEGGNFHRVRV